MNSEKARRMPGVSAASAEAPGLWRECGVAIYGDGPDVGIICHGDYEDIREGRFTSWSNSQFNYCPSARWEKWVALAKRILEIDAEASR